MLKLFRKDVFLQAFIIIILAGVLWSRSFVNQTAIPTQGGGYIYYQLAGWIPPIVATILGFILMLLEGFLLNMQLYKNKLINQNTLMPMLFYVIAMSLTTDQLTLTPILIGNLFIITCIDNLMLTSTYLSLPIGKTFGAAASIAMATIFCPAMSAFLIPLVINIFNLSLYGWRDLTMIVLGLLAPYIMVETYYFVVDEMFYQNYLFLYDITNINFVFHGSMYQWIGSILFALLVLIGLFASVAVSQSKGINFKKNTSTVMIFFLGSICYLGFTQVVPMTSQCFAVPLALATTMLFYEKKRNETVWSILLLLIIVAAFIWNIM